MRAARKIKIASLLLIALGAVYTASASLTMYIPLVSSDAGRESLKQMKDNTNVVAERMWKTRSAHGLPFTGEQPLTLGHVTGINQLAADAVQSRNLFFEHEHVYVWTHILNDIEAIHRKMNGFGSSDGRDAEQRIQELNDALTEVADNRARAMKTLEGTKLIVDSQIGMTKKNLYTDVQMVKTLLDAGTNDQLLLTQKAHAPPFADIARLQNAYWAVFELHQNMVRDYEQANRLPSAARILVGR